MHSTYVEEEVLTLHLTLTTSQGGPVKREPMERLDSLCNCQKTNLEYVAPAKKKMIKSITKLDMERVLSNVG